jgi:hypothetical protein
VMPRNTPSRTGARAWGSARACAGDGPERRRRLCDARAFSRRRVQAVAVGSRDARMASGAREKDALIYLHIYVYHVAARARARRRERTMATRVFDAGH